MVMDKKLSNKIVHDIKQKILSGALRTGDRLPAERDLAEKYKVSRITIRNAISRLVYLGFLQTLPQSGTFIADFNKNASLELLVDIINVSRGKRKETGTDDAIPCILEPVERNKALRKNWARLIQKIYQVDPLVCPKCKGNMRIISFIEDAHVIREILTHLGFWLVRSRPPPKIHDPPGREDFAANLQIQPHSEIIYGDPEYSWNDYIQS